MEIAQKYDDGMLVKTADELEAADDRDDSMPLMFYDGHTKQRTVGFALKPKGIDSYNKGKIKRDVFFDKDELTPQEIDSLRQAPYSSKKDLSIGFLDNTEYKKDVWNGVSIDGYSRDIKLDHLAWVELGRCSSTDGCGLTRSDEMRYDAFPPEKEKGKEKPKDKPKDKNANDCVAKKTKTFIAEGMDAAKAKAAAQKFCSEKSKGKKDSAELHEDKETVFLEKEQGDIIETLPEQDTAEASIMKEGIGTAKNDKSDLILEKLDSLGKSFQQFVSQYVPKTDEQDNPCDCEEDRKDGKPVVEEERTDEKIKEEVERYDSLKLEFDELKQRFDILSNPKREFNMKDLEAYEKKTKGEE